jgi:hypothetical protein
MEKILISGIAVNHPTRKDGWFGSGRDQQYSFIVVDPEMKTIHIGISCAEF